jgi:hypothetical protein
MHYSVIFYVLVSVPYALLAFAVFRAHTAVSLTVGLIGAFFIFTLAVLAYSYAFFAYITVLESSGFLNVVVYQTLFALIAWLVIWICQRKRHQDDEKHVA